jgi:hypothetical protein
MDSGAWVGSEGDLFRAQVAEIPLHLYPNAFRSEEELVKTLGHERTHVRQVKTHGYPTEAERQVYEDAAKATEAQWGTTTR